MGDGGAFVLPGRDLRPISHRAMMASREAGLDSEDFFPTEPWAGRWLAEFIRQVLDPQARRLWECACGAGHLAHGLAASGHQVLQSDAYPYDGNLIHDFLGDASPPFVADWVVTNPPFADGKIEAFIRQAWAVARRGVAMLLPMRCVEGVERHGLFQDECRLTLVAPTSERLSLAKGRWDPKVRSATLYAWYFFLKPVLRPRRFMARVGGELHPGMYLIPPGTRARLTDPGDLARFAALDRAGVGKR